MALTMRASTVMGAKVAPAQKATVRPRAAAPVMALREDIVRIAKGAAVATTGLALALSAQAAEVKLGAAGGALVFEPSSVTIKSGETVTWVNNVGFPHNVVFDEDDVPSGVDAGAISHDDYLNAPGETVSSKFTAPGEYGYYCEPHQGAGMVGRIIVK